MRAENIEVTFKIPINVNGPDKNGVIYTYDAIKNASVKNKSGLPIIYICNKLCNICDNLTLPIGVVNKIELIEENEKHYILAVGILRSGGTCELVDIKDDTVTSMEITGVGFCEV